MGEPDNFPQLAIPAISKARFETTDRPNAPDAATIGWAWFRPAKIAEPSGPRRAKDGPFASRPHRHGAFIVARYIPIYTALLGFGWDHGVAIDLKAIEQLATDQSSLKAAAGLAKPW